MSSVRLLNKKVSHILDEQSKLEAELEVNLHDEDGWKALEQPDHDDSGHDSVLPLDRAWSLMRRDYGCCGTEKPAKRAEVESTLRLSSAATSCVLRRQRRSV